MSEPSTVTAFLDAELAALGRMNFSQDCRAGDRLARLAMDERQVYLLVDGEPTRRALFDAAGSAGSATTRTLTLNGTATTVEFTHERDAARFDRVLAVRQGVAPDVGMAGANLAPVGLSRHASESDYEAWAGFAMAGSVVLMISGAISLVVGVVAGLVTLGAHGAVGLLVIAGAVLGAALPLSVAALIRVVILRHRLEDARRP